ncbi:hypothetical protein GCM10007880_64150 [Mesorhizobium amorphae]|nr:hypothetical protein GCM10007880_64150 [Mesorhizobium amorphae]
MAKAVQLQLANTAIVGLTIMIVANKGEDECRHLPAGQSLRESCFVVIFYLSGAQVLKGPRCEWERCRS